MKTYMNITAIPNNPVQTKLISSIVKRTHGRHLIKDTGRQKASFRSFKNARTAAMALAKANLKVTLNYNGKPLPLYEAGKAAPEKKAKVVTPKNVVTITKAA
jgi:hypothetical protein